MRKIKIFIGSSIDDLAFERRDLVSFIAELNNRYVDRGIYIEPYICEEKSNEMRPEGSQQAHDDYIANDADAMIFMFFTKAGPYTLRELQVAKATLSHKGKNVHIFIYFKTIDNEVANTAEIKAAIDKIAGEYAHYYKRFSETDTIKLELLQYLSATLDESALRLHNGTIYLGETEISSIELSKIFAYQNNGDLMALKKEISELEKKMRICIEQNDWNQLARLSIEHQKKQSMCSEIETEIFNMLQQLFLCLRQEKPNPMRIKALMLLEEGKYKEALLLLPLNEITTKANTLTARVTLLEESVKQEANEILQDGIARIRALELGKQSVDTDEQVQETYAAIWNVALIAGQSRVLMTYALLLDEKDDSEKIKPLLKAILNNFNRFEDIDLYTKYDTYNLLSDYSENEEERNYYSELAQASLFEYVSKLDKNNWEIYVDTCCRLLELVDTRQVLPYLEEAVQLAEAHHEEDKSAWPLYQVYWSLAVFYEERELDNTSAEKYYLKATQIVEQELNEVGYLLEEAQKKLNGKPMSCKIAVNTHLWFQYYVVLYEHLYKINPNKYQKEYLNALFAYALIDFLVENYVGFKEYLTKVAHLSGDDPVYNWVRALVARMNLN